MRWARKLPINNAYAKSILRALANYMNEDGSAYPGLSTLAEDTDINEDTIAGRLRWLESIGAIVILKNWMDERGNRNCDGVGRPTSWEIRFLIDADIAEIAERAKTSSKTRQLSGAARASHEARVAESPPESRLSDSDESTISDRPGRYLKGQEPPPASPGLATEQPPTASVRILNLEQEDSPLPPFQGGDGSAINLVGEEKSWSGSDTWPAFEIIWTEPILRQSIARQVYSALTEDERTAARKAAAGYVAYRRSQKKPPNVINAHTFLREREAWAKFAELAPPEPKAPTAPKPETWLDASSDEFHAFALMKAINRKPIPKLANGITFIGNLPAGAAALAALITRDTETGEIDKSSWTIAGKNTPVFVAWCERASEWLGFWPDEQRIWLDEHDNIVAAPKDAAITPSGLPRCRDGLLVPFTENGFPPAKGEPANTS